MLRGAGTAYKAMKKENVEVRVSKQVFVIIEEYKMDVNEAVKLHLEALRRKFV
jgi:hypothetical protein